MGDFFGTDGIRGIAGEFLSPELALSLAKATAKVMGKGKKLKVIIGMDTRASGQMLEAALAAGFSAMGADVYNLGVLPTPAVSYLTEKYSADIGVMISASHNPYEYNGIKIFSGEGFKLPDETEEEIEKLLLTDVEGVGSGEMGGVFSSENGLRDYVEYILSTVEKPIARDKKLKVLIDCANGSASATAEDIFSNLDIDFSIIQNLPDGININANCGSTHIEEMSEDIVNGNFDLGIAFDGDADRVLMLDHEGKLVDGDKLLAIMMGYYKEEDRLKDNTVVCTVMTNLGFFDYAKLAGINTAVCKVGDRYVLEEMEAKGYCLGGEQSGHLIIREHMKTGDGQLTALHVLVHMIKSGKSLASLASVMETYPQILENVRLSAGAVAAELLKDKEVLEAEQKWADIFGQSGRILLRASGTEPLVRVMVEGKDMDKVRGAVREISDKIKERMG